MKRNSIVGGCLVSISLMASAGAQQLPYNPAQILRPPHRRDLVYIFRPSQDGNQFQLSSIDVSSNLRTTNLAETVLYPTLPFLRNDQHDAFTAAMGDDGRITAVTGNCVSSSGARVWTFVPDERSKDGNGTWSEQPLAEGSAEHGASVPYYLASGVSFSPILNPATGKDNISSMYIFGGMCPQSGSPTTAATWQADAGYSNTMCKINPAAGNSQASINSLSSRGPPIAQAGFTMTGLSPTLSNRTDGSMNRQRDYVLVGGQTARAFINMSQVALYSLPQETWAYLPVSSAASGRTDLVKRDGNEVEPRSGHSAVLSEDGTKVVVFGGWVGDISTPASPPLAVLNLGEDYGGTGTWSWSIPTANGKVSGLTSLYGHAATLLAGDVMMIVGGYQVGEAISQAQGFRISRRQSGALNSKAFFFNISSSTWIEDYVPPEILDSGQHHNNEPLSSPSQKAGLGVGVGIGGAILLGLVITYLLFARRSRSRRDAKEHDAQDLSYAGDPDLARAMTSPDAWRNLGGPYDGICDPYAYGVSVQGGAPRPSAGEAERTGLLVDVPSPTRGLRRNIPRRPLGQTDKQVTHHSGLIHPIEEREEEDANNGPEGALQRLNGERGGINPLGAHPPAHSRDLSRFHPRLVPSGAEGDYDLLPPAEKRKSEIQSWTEGWERAASHMAQNGAQQAGRTSPSKSDRTSSTISGRSWFSNSDDNAPSPAAGITGAVATLSRTLSARINSALVNPFAPELNHSREGDVGYARHSGHGRPLTTAALMSDRSSQPSPTKTLDSGSGAGSDGSERGTSAGKGEAGDAHPFSTSQGTILRPQSENDALLGGPRRAISWQTRSTGALPGPSAAESGLRSRTDGDHFPERSGFWSGSVRRVFGHKVSAAPGRKHAAGTVKVGKTRGHDVRGPEMQEVDRGASTALGGPPRRAVSDAGFWRTRKGARDWGWDGTERDRSTTMGGARRGDDWGAPEDADPFSDRSACEAGGGGASPGQEDWDVEAAAENRVVQVMFSVPRTRLRVVNAHAADQQSLISLEDRAEPEPQV